MLSKLLKTIEITSQHLPCTELQWTFEHTGLALLLDLKNSLCRHIFLTQLCNHLYQVLSLYFAIR